MAEIHSFKEYLKENFEDELFDKLNDYVGSNPDRVCMDCDEVYSGNQIVVFYGSNSWAYTRMGHITDQDAAGMAELLGNGDVTITISME